ncbi:hypothetical protein HD593_008500 [Nonomuraea rubra]|uniref:Uncharacterized protein n=1 Tax=Nonomuraea rubra TaxID=46180 RepID=A0A7X0P1U8_9ACTN|nr:hypothetical protein [Nonomuraea rubra]
MLDRSGRHQRAPGRTREIPMVKTARRYAKYAISTLSTAIFVLNG